MSGFDQETVGGSEGLPKLSGEKELRPDPNQSDRPRRVSQKRAEPSAKRRPQVLERVCPSILVPSHTGRSMTMEEAFWVARTIQ